MSYFSEIPQKEDSIDGLNGSLDLSDVSELTITNFDPEDEPQIGKKKFIIKMVIDSVRYCIFLNLVAFFLFFLFLHDLLVFLDSPRQSDLSAPDEEVMMVWYDRIKKQMAKIAMQYNTAARGVGVMKQYRKSMMDPSGQLRTSTDQLRASSLPDLRSSGGTPGQSEFDQMSQLNPLFKVLMAMDVKDEDIWEGKEWIYPVLRHFSTEVFAAAMTFPINVVSIVFPERGPLVFRVRVTRLTNACPSIASLP